MRKEVASMIGLVLVIWTGAYAQAGIVLSTTRVVYPAQDKEAVLSVLNKNKGTILLQSWLETAESSDQDLPFAVVPPLVPLSGGGRQTVRVIHSGAAMPAQRESLFWLNVQEIPQAAEHENALQIGIRQRIKLFYRPSGLVGEADQAPAQLSWALSAGAGLTVANGSPYHVTLLDIELLSGAARQLYKKNAMLAPGQELSFKLPSPVAQQQATLNFKSINDHGAVVPFRLSAGDWPKGRARGVEH